MDYYALVGDMKQSRKSKNRSGLQELLLETLGGVNAEFSEFIAADLMVNAGDSFQGILPATAPILAICDRIRFSLIGECGIRLGLGFGEIQTRIDRKQSILADGPAFWKAREALDIVNELDYYDTHSIHLCIAAGQHPLWVQTLVNQVLVGQDLLVAKWKNTQLTLARQYLVHHGYEKISQTTLAKELGLTVQQVNTTIQAMGFLAYLDMKRNTEQTLIQVLGGSTT